MGRKPPPRDVQRCTRTRRASTPPIHEPSSEEEQAPRRTTRRTKGKEVDGESSQLEQQYAPHPPRPRKEAPYIVPMGGPMPQPTAPKKKKGPAHEICPTTPEHLKIEYGPDQLRKENCPKIHQPMHPFGYDMVMPRDYYKQALVVKDAKKKDPFEWDKEEGIEERFWNRFHEDFYISVIRRKPKPPIVNMQYVNWKYFEEKDDAIFKQVVAKCKEYGLYDLMGFKYDWNEEILAQFHCSYYYRQRDNTIHWTTERKHYFIDYMTFSRLLGLGSKDEKKNPIHMEDKLKAKDVRLLFFNPIGAHEKKAHLLLPFYYVLDSLLRSTVDPKIGDPNKLHHLAPNLLNRFAPEGKPFCIFDYIWNELRRAMDDSRKCLPYAPYLMYMIERVTKFCYPKDHVHEPMTVRPRKENVPTPTPHKFVGSSSQAPHSDDVPFFPSRRTKGSMVKRVLRSIFTMCKHMATEINENRRDIIELKREANLPCDTYHELLEFDDPFAEWDAMDAATAVDPTHPPTAIAAAYSSIAAPRRSPLADDEEETEEEEPLQYRQEDDDDEDTESNDGEEDDEDDE
ncbi:unnamed protein product [Urochloa humidicola]